MGAGAEVANLPEALGIPGASDYLGYKESTLRTSWWRDRVGIPFHQRAPGARIVFYRHELDQWRERTART